MRGTSQKIGIYIDAVNIARNGGFGMRFDISATSPAATAENR